ncbi:MAG: peptide MFS transporter, partial [Gemmatimonadales bacterium]
TGLMLIVIGTGLLKPNVSTMVGQLYGEDDHRRDAGFSIFYMGINLGAFLAPFLTGWLAQSDQFRALLRSVGLAPESAWHWGFGLAAVGMFFGLVQYLAGWKHLGRAGLEPAEVSTPEARARRRRLLGLAVLVTLAIVGLAMALQLSHTVAITPQLVSRAFGYLLLAVVAGTFGSLLLSSGWTPMERKRLIVILVLFCASSMFWAVYEQAGSTLNLFAARNTDTNLLGYSFPPSWFQSVPALFVITLAPVFAWVWVKLGPREPSSPAKFTIGLVLVALGFAVLIVPAALSANGARVSPLWLVLTYLLHVVGELCLSPVGLSATTRLAPARVAGLMMGVWFLSISVGSYLGGRVASGYDVVALPTLFGMVAAAALLAGVLLAFAIKPIGRMLATKS